MKIINVFFLIFALLMAPITTPCELQAKEEAGLAVVIIGTTFALIGAVAAPYIVIPAIIGTGVIGTAIYYAIKAFRNNSQNKNTTIGSSANSAAAAGPLKSASFSPDENTSTNKKIDANPDKNTIYQRYAGSISKI